MKTMDKIDNTSLIDNLIVYDVFSKKIRLGKNADGGYVINELLLKKARKLVTIGYGNESSFEKDWCELTQKKVDIYDGSCNCQEICSEYPNLVSYKKQHISSISEIFLESEDEILLKVDIEGMEHSIFSQQQIKNVAGIIIEIHWIHTENNRREFLELINNTFSEFLIFHIHGNSHGGVFELQEKNTTIEFPVTLELSFIHKKYVEKYDIDFTTKYPTILDFSNAPYMQDINLPWVNLSRKIT